jgi:hypothetical protein
MEMIKHFPSGLAFLRPLHQDNPGRVLGVILACALATAAAPSLFGQAITSISPATLPAGSKDTTITVYGTGFGLTQRIWVGCYESKPLDVEAKGDDKTFYVQYRLPEAALENPASISFSTKACDSQDQRPAGTKYLFVVKPTFTDMAPWAEGLVGIDVSAASSVSPAAEFLGLAVVDIPLGSNIKISSPHPRLVWLSGQLGLKGMAQPGAISGAASAGYYASAINATPDKIVQSLDVSLHLGMQLRTWSNDIDLFPVGTRPAGTDPPPGTVTTLSLIMGGGAVTPLSFSQANPQVFEATPSVLTGPTALAPITQFSNNCSQPPLTAPSVQCYFFFDPTDRTHFYRYYDGGLRLKIYASDYTDKERRFPAILDLTIGQNEYVTGGRLQGAVLHVGAMLPIPHADSFFIYGSIDMGLSNNNGGGPQLQLVPVPVETPAITTTSANVYPVLTSQPSRDRYQFGFGIDAIHFFSSLKKTKSSSPSGT